MTNIAIVGFGYWGKNLVRNFNSLDSCEVIYVCEKDTPSGKKCLKLYPNITVVSDYDILLKDDTLHAIVIATPVNTHYYLAKAALSNGKHVLVEKPLTDSFSDAQELKILAQEKRKILMCDFTFLYTGAVRYLKEQIEKDNYGNIKYIDSTRINLGLFQHDVNVLWDLAPHDISICTWLLNKKPVSLQATGISHTGNDIENIAFLTLKYDNNLIIHFNCSWVSPVKIRKMLIGGDKKMVLFNDMEPSEKIKVYDTGFNVSCNDDEKKINADYRVGDIYVPKITNTEALSLMAIDFINSIKTGNPPAANAKLAVDVVEILECAQESIKSKGKEVKLT